MARAPLGDRWWTHGASLLRADQASQADDVARPRIRRPDAKPTSGRLQVCILQVVTPHYRQGIFDLLAQRLAGQVRVYTGDRAFDATICHGLGPRPYVQRVVNHMWLRRRLLWQQGSLRPGLASYITIVPLNPRIVSVWLIMLMRRALRRPTIAWGHPWPRAGKETASDRVRQLMRRMANVLLVYTEADAQALSVRMPNARVVAAPNALYSAFEIGGDYETREPTNFISVGRLIAAKRPHLLLDAYLEVADRLPHEHRLVFVGDGPERHALEHKVHGAGLGDRVRFEGHVSDITCMRSLFANALASVSPGYVGLSLIQSLSFGVPMAIARSEPHAPEIAAAVDGYNCVMFDSDSAADLGRTLLELAATRSTWVERRRAIATECASGYSTERMLEGFVEALGLVGIDEVRPLEAGNPRNCKIQPQVSATCSTELPCMARITERRC